MPKTLKYKEFDRIERLKRRAEWLRQRIQNNTHGGTAYDKGELSALEWAIPLLEDHMMHKTIKAMPSEVRQRFGFDRGMDEDEIRDYELTKGD